MLLVSSNVSLWIGDLPVMIDITFQPNIWEITSEKELIDNHPERRWKIQSLCRTNLHVVQIQFDNREVGGKDGVGGDSWIWRDSGPWTSPWTWTWTWTWTSGPLTTGRMARVEVVGLGGIVAQSRTNAPPDCTSNPLCSIFALLLCVTFFSELDFRIVS